jgi:hypothetical protein
VDYIARHHARVKSGVSVIELLQVFDCTEGPPMIDLHPARGNPWWKEKTMTNIEATLLNKIRARSGSNAVDPTHRPRQSTTAKHA